MEFMRGRRILEINPNHPIIQDLNVSTPILSISCIFWSSVHIGNLIGILQTVSLLIYLQIFICVGSHYLGWFHLAVCLQGYSKESTSPINGQPSLWDVLADQCLHSKLLLSPSFEVKLHFLNVDAELKLSILEILCGILVFVFCKINELYWFSSLRIQQNLVEGCMKCWAWLWLLREVQVQVKTQLQKIYQVKLRLWRPQRLLQRVTLGSN